MHDNIDKPTSASLRAADIAAEPDALRWARDCGWLPGTGYCRNHPCGRDCLFRPQREAESLRLVESRRQRRRAASRIAQS
ncbi:MAG: hypothetical protein ACM3JG_07435 [Thiohalocapsa sp.]